ncbi:hypothetical protein [Actinacidiphila bryophytorum]|uniref:hypothetical protein n=1 Tax=Actinacidiphila bryophytorum TaxID=1436133 RepID=UPI002176C758|nr:hypothetical protein [Actinacidiphila bryophytorum]UWE10217.1 hypothetical protein NYE86_16860 [Actinacidiphila bryophytorum]
MSVSTSSYALDQVINERWQTIAHYPMPDAHSCINRHIYLAGPHTYRWYLVEDSTNYGERDITLVTGWYQWSDCLSYAGLYMYDHVSSLNPDSTGYKTAYLECLEAQRHDSGSTTAYWGSTLIP